MKHAIRLLILTLGLFSALVNSAQLPSYYPQEGFKRVGNIDAVDINNHRVIINDSLFMLSDETALHSLSKKNDSLHRLSKGAKVGIEYEKTGQYKVIKTIWLLPINYQPTDGREKKGLERQGNRR